MLSLFLNAKDNIFKNKKNIRVELILYHYLYHAHKTMRI